MKYGADRGTDDGTDQSCTEMDPKLGQQPGYQALGRGKKPRDEQGDLALTWRGKDLSICRGHLGRGTTERLVGLRGQIGIQRTDLL